LHGCAAGNRYSTISAFYQVVFKKSLIYQIVYLSNEDKGKGRLNGKIVFNRWDRQPFRRKEMIPISQSLIFSLNVIEAACFVAPAVIYVQ